MYTEHKENLSWRDLSQVFLQNTCETSDYIGVTNLDTDRMSIVNYLLLTYPCLNSYVFLSSVEVDYKG